MNIYTTKSLDGEEIEFNFAIANLSLFHLTILCMTNKKTFIVKLMMAMLLLSGTWNYYFRRSYCGIKK